MLRLLFIMLFLFIHNKLCYGHTFLASKDLGLSTREMGQALTENISCWDSTQLWRCIFNVTFFWSRKWGFVWFEVKFKLNWLERMKRRISQVLYSSAKEWKSRKPEERPDENHVTDQIPWMSTLNEFHSCIKISNFLNDFIGF